MISCVMSVRHEARGGVAIATPSRDMMRSVPTEGGLRPAAFVE